MILKDLIPILDCDFYDNELVRFVEDGEVLQITAWADECGRHLVVTLK